MNTYSAIIIDDEDNNRENLKDLLLQHCSEVKVLGMADSAMEGIKLIKKHHPQIVFLDIQMPYGSGFDMLEGIDEIDFEIIFVTAFNQYAIKAIKFSALDYILKPINIEELKNAIDKIGRKLSTREKDSRLNNFLTNINKHESDKKIALPTSDELKFIPVKEIIHCKGDNNYTHIVLTSGEKIMVSKTLKDFEELLEEFNFIRVHQSHLVNIHHVKTFVKTGGGSIIMSNNEQFPVSRQKKEMFIKKMNEVYKSVSK